MEKAGRAAFGLSDGRRIDIVKGKCPPASGLSLERNGDGERGIILSAGEGEEPGQGHGVRVRGGVARNELLPNFIGPGQEQDLQRLADELGRLLLEQSGADGLGCHDKAGLVNRHGQATLFELGRGLADRQAGSQAGRVGLWFRQGRHGTPGLCFRHKVHKVAT